MNVAIVALLSASLAVAVAPEDLRQSLDVRIPLLPPLVQSGGRSLSAFEVHATNFTGDPLSVRALRIVDAEDGTLLATYAGAALAARMRIVGLPPAPSSAVLPPGGRAVLFVELDLAPRAALHAIRTEIDCATSDGVSFTVRDSAKQVDPRPIATLMPPMRTGTWVAVHDPSWDRGHRRVLYTLRGAARIPGRYAIDWVGVDAQGKVSRGDPDRPADAVGYGTAVLAGADAVVADVQDGMREPLSISGAPRQPLGSGSGNYVVLDLGAGRFAFYEHLKPGSITVRRGDRVRAGQAIGALGASGDTTGPHLHLHVADCASPLECEGLPFTIRGMTQIGMYRSLSDLGSKAWSSGGAPGATGVEWPSYNVVVRFSGPGSSAGAAKDARSRHPGRGG